MKRNVKALAILSLFGLGLASVTSCGPQGPSITISVDGEEVENGGIATVSQGIDFKLSANIYGGAEGETVRWSTNATSVFTFSSTTENDVTASANEATNQGYTIRATLASDSSITASITLMVNPSEMSYKIYVDTTDAQVNYGTGESFTSDGLVVGVQQYAGDTPTSNRYDLGEEEYIYNFSYGLLKEMQTGSVYYLNFIDVTFTLGEGNFLESLDVKNDVYVVSDLKTPLCKIQKMTLQKLLIMFLLCF